MLFVAIFLAPKLLWLAKSEAATGEVWFTGHDNLGSTLGITTYQVVRFAAGSDTIKFNGNVDLSISPGTMVNILYQKDDLYDAKINTFKSVWGSTLVYCLFPLLVLLALFFHPEAIPKKSRIRIGGKRIISII